MDKAMTNDKKTPTVLPTLTPPLKFNSIQPNLFRGSYPRPINYDFLKSLHLKTMVAILEKPITDESDPKLLLFIKENNINLINMECTKGGKGKKRGIPIDTQTIIRVIEMVLDQDQYPIYLFCINGGQITSLVVSCLRKVSFWSSISIFNEFMIYSTTINHNDRVFIENFHGDIKLPKHRVDWIWKGLSKGVIDHHPTLKFIEQ